MKKFLSIAVVVAGVFSAHAAWSAPKKAPVGDALKRTKSLKFDGRSVESVGAGRYNSFTHLNEGQTGAGSKKLYSLPSSFASRTADEIVETEYRK